MKIIQTGRPVACFDSSEPRFILTEDFVVEGNGGIYYKVPTWFITDGASIPECLFWWDWGLFDYAAIAHDYCYVHGQIMVSSDGIIYKEQPLTKKEADKLFYDMLLGFGVGKITSFLMYLAVRWFGMGYKI